MTYQRKLKCFDVIPPCDSVEESALRRLRIDLYFDLNSEEEEFLFELTRAYEALFTAYKRLYKFAWFVAKKRDSGLLLATIANVIDIAVKHELHMADIIRRVETAFSQPDDTFGEGLTKEILDLSKSMDSDATQLVGDVRCMMQKFRKNGLLDRLSSNVCKVLTLVIAIVIVGVVGGVAVIIGILTASILLSLLWPVSGIPSYILYGVVTLLEPTQTAAEAVNQRLYVFGCSRLEVVGWLNLLAELDKEPSSPDRCATVARVLCDLRRFCIFFSTKRGLKKLCIAHETFARDPSWNGLPSYSLLPNLSQPVPSHTDRNNHSIGGRDVPIASPHENVEAYQPSTPEPEPGPSRRDASACVLIQLNPINVLTSK
ncbi:uncharacterized protein EV420DRAFT_9934 [Desarmillaria tabescens]|uniref:Uncharacterized protein n=1 Tax=Armillaria tabescens TaxID=1929756 RepID=A0AA39NNY5_ARMTA|nr:uncharacterized protein EV420DRAFT_9934 [Desarmillaria tabescens]KAK0469141.1 hypothetical protein EV420DRAFT_9934 [Desarmillaria tabescens]